MDARELIDGVEDFGPISDINVTPFIDIMLVLLIIFMVTAPLMLGGVRVNLPKSGGDPMPRPENPAIVSMDAQNRVFIDKEELPNLGRHERFQALARESETGEVYVRGDGEVKYARMMELMAELGQAGFARVTLVTDVKAGKATPTADHGAPAADPGAPPAADPVR
ncbi:MAG: ExbD/TolR family protein [Candidatus Adiutrix sp.]|jgi:biopolymer transport protein ExbD|nr:ExbD/TolR family protein [Candidatus Adiutrix sp.]